MREAVIVASSRTPLAKSHRGSFNSLIISKRRRLRFDRAAITRRPGSISAFTKKQRATAFNHGNGGWKDTSMRLPNIVPKECHRCGKPTSLAAIEPHPTHPELELHTYSCEDCGPVRTVSHRKEELIRAA
jgi:hypothetical protein